MKKELAQMMFDKKLDFLPIEESLRLFEAGELVETTYWWVANIEELGGGEDEMTVREIYMELEEIMGDFGYSIGDPEDHFDEFTYRLCPAPTYIDLIK